MRRIITTIDLHTAGEPFRVVTGGIAPIPGATMGEKLDYAAAELDETRRLLTYEPRGHTDMYGCFMTAPVEDASVTGAIFFDGEGFSTVCGHGSIALATALVELGMITAPAAGQRIVGIDAPAGTTAVIVTCNEGRVTSAEFRNVGAYVEDQGLVVDTTRGVASIDVVYGGAYFALTQAESVGLEVEIASLPELRALARQIKHELERRKNYANEEHARVKGIDGVVFLEQTQNSPLVVRNVTIFADGAVDRSPCGSGTSAQLALLYSKSTIGVGQSMRSVSIIDTAFEGRIVSVEQNTNRDEVFTGVTGSSYVTGIHSFVLDERDPLLYGFRVTS